MAAVNKHGFIETLQIKSLHQNHGKIYFAVVQHSKHHQIKPPNSTL